MAQAKTVPGKIGDYQLDWKKGLCGICPAGCWVEVGLRNGELVDIRQDTSHKLGMICRRGQHAPEIIYSQHRLRYPMKRVGPKDSYEFERITWDEAYNIIVENLNMIKEESGPEPVAIYTGRGAQELSLYFSADQRKPANITLMPSRSPLTCDSARS